MLYEDILADKILRKKQSAPKIKKQKFGSFYLYLVIVQGEALKKFGTRQQAKDYINPL